MDDGRVIGDRFVLGARVAIGGMGSIHEARDRIGGAPVAVKLLVEVHERDRDRFERETTALASLAHPGIVRYLAHGETERGERWIAMAWIEGVTLATFLDDGIGIADAVRVARQVAVALGEAHRHGLLHRDIKPANIMLEGGAVGAVRLVDFGLARRVADEQRLTLTGLAVGTPGYMAPEQVRGARDVDGRLDQFALGCLLYECLAGHAPFEGENPLAIQLKVLMVEAPPLPAAVPDGLRAIVGRLLAKEPGDRYAEIGALVDALDALGPLPATPSPRRRRAPEATRVDVPAPSCLVLASVRRADDAWRARAREAAAAWPHEALLDGTLVIRQLAAAEAARCGLVLAAALPEATVVVTASREPRGEDVVDRGTRVMSVAALRAVLARAATGGRAYVDRQTVALLGGAHDVVEDGPLLYLRERRP